jgi:proliferating cell nuclear antigen
MFQAALSQVTVFRKIIESLKDLVSEVNLDATAEGLSLQAMDSAHVSLVALKINEGAFEDYRCDKPLTLGINLSDFSKILKMAKNDDLMILSSDENTSSLSIVFDNKSKDIQYINFT